MRSANCLPRRRFAGRWASAPGPACSPTTTSIAWSATSPRSIASCSRNARMAKRMLRRAVLIIGLVALAHSALYILYQRGEWQSATAWTDQRGYQRLGATLATTGQFTRYADTDVFVPEVIRTPGYPAFVAVVYRLFGVGNDLAVAIAQAFVFARDLLDGVRNCAPGRRRSQRHRRGADDGALLAAALLRIAHPDRALDRVHGDRGHPGLPACRSAGSDPRLRDRRRCSSARRRWSGRLSC